MPVPIKAGNGRTGVERQVVILGQDLTLKATGTVSADGGQLLIEPETIDLRELKGALKPKRTGVTLADMEAAIRAHASKR